MNKIMELKTKQIEFTAENVGIICMAIKNGKERELPIPIFHAYEKGYICVGVGSGIIAFIDGKFERLNIKNYLLVCSLGGGLSMIEDEYMIPWKYDIIK